MHIDEIHKSKRLENKQQLRVDNVDIYTQNTTFQAFAMYILDAAKKTNRKQSPSTTLVLRVYQVSFLKALPVKRCSLLRKRGAIQCHRRRAQSFERFPF